MNKETINLDASPDPDEIKAEIMLLEMELREVRFWGKHAAGPNRRIAAGRREKKLEQELADLKNSLCPALTA